MAVILLTAFIYLFAAVAAVSICKRLGLGSVLGYLLAGVAIGPVLGLVSSGQTQAIQHVSEFGVVMMLFLVGLELEPAKLWQLKNKLLGLGGLQVIGSIAVIAAGCIALGLPWQTGIAAGCVLALSSTAIVMQTLGEKGLLQSPGGQSSFAVLLFQDIAAIPMLALLPLIAIPELMHAAPAHAEAAEHADIDLLAGLNSYLKAAITLGVIAGIVIGGHYLSRPVFRYIAASRMRELFTITALTLVVGIAALMSLIGLSPALGTFIAGVVLANNEYRHELESDLEPFKGILLGLFFITVGAGINFALLFDNFFTILGLTLAVMAVKALVLWALGAAFKLDKPNRLLFALGLAQAGEFGFVLLSFSVGAHIMSQAVADQLLLVVALSMLLTPLLFIAYDRLAAKTGSETREQDAIDEENPIIVLGHGRFGQMIVGMLNSCGYKCTIIDYDSKTVDGMNRFGFKTYFGDATRMDLLETAGLESAKLLVIAIDGEEQAVEIAEHVSRLRPDLPMVIRAYDRRNVFDIYRACAGGGAAPNADIVRETFDAAIRAGRLSLEALGIDREKAGRLADLYYHRDRRSVRLMAEHYDPSLPRWTINEAMLQVAKQDDAETDLLMQALMRGDPVDWRPDPD